MSQREMKRYVFLPRSIDRSCCRTGSFWHSTKCESRKERKNRQGAYGTNKLKSLVMMVLQSMTFNYLNSSSYQMYGDTSKVEIFPICVCVHVCAHGCVYQGLSESPCHSWKTCIVSLSVLWQYDGLVKQCSRWSPQALKEILNSRLLRMYFVQLNK